MNLVEFLENLSQQNVELWVENDKLRYRAPKEALTPTLLNQIKQHKTEIVDLLSENFDSSKSYSLSYGQQGLWFMYKLAPHSAAYNIAFTVRICSHLNIPALQRAVQTLVARHPALRTKFSQGDGAPFQEIQESQEVYIQTIDASSWDEDKLTQEAIAAYKLPFDLSRGVMRVTLFAHSSEEYVLLLVIHHIAVDGFSFGIILDELRLLYEGENTGSSVSLAPVEYSYQDFVRWQQIMLKSPVGEELWTYWQKQFAGELPVLNMPTDYPRPLVQNNQGTCYNFELNQGLAHRLRELGKAEGVTLYMTLLAAFAVLLHRYTGQSEIVVGSPTEGRSKAEFANTVGFFVNMLAMRINLASNPSFSELLSQVRKTVLAALTHQDYPTPLLIERLELNRDPSLLGLFRASFNLLQFQQMAPEYELSMSTKTAAREDWGGLKLKPFVIPQQQGQNDLVLDIVETAESLIGIFRYSTDLFDEATIGRMTDNFQTLLEGIVTNPEQDIALLPLLSGVEQHRLLKEWNNNQVEYPSCLCIHQLFEEQVKKTPNAIAVSFQDQQLTYQELNERANQLARYLHSLGVQPEVLVGICVERSLEMVIGKLGILKAGGAYVPLDPAYPADRLSYIVNDAQVPVLLTKHKWVMVESKHPMQVVCFDTQWEVISGQNKENPITNVQANNLAYVIYTSGSTGKPKGVAIEHRSLVNFSQAALAEYDISANDRVLQFASISFDTAAEEIYPCLSCGGTLVLRTEEMLKSVPEFVQQSRDLQISVWNFPTAYWHLLCSELANSNLVLPKSLRLVIIGGERALPEQIAIWYQCVGDSIYLTNGYGPTEATVTTTVCKLSAERLDIQGTSIGRPINNALVYILDQYLQPVPIGVPGELHIGGVGLARGYLNRPDLTQQKFIPNPFENGVKKERIYKTGDLARYLPDGNIEFLGRIDNQVKLRGFRIELGEIEAVLSTHPQVQEVVVILREEQVDNKYLVAYFVTRQKSLSTKEIRDFIKQKLPNYMVPSAFVSLEALPLTPNGKIDRRALPVPDIEENRQVEFVPPRTSTEVAIADIFISVLKLQRVGIHDNFFELGGHSLLATQVVSRLQQTFNVEFPLRSLLESPTVAGLDGNLAQYRLVESPSETLAPLPTIVPTPEQRHQPFPLTDIQQAYWLGRNDAFELGNIAAHGYIELDSNNLNLQRLNLAWQKLIDRHDMLRVIIIPDGQQQVQEVVPPYEIELLDLCGQPPEVVNARLDSIRDRMSHEVLSADRFPLFEIRATRLDEVCTRLHLSFDALIADAWSIFVLGREWAKLYENPEIVLPPLELSFRDYVLAELTLSNTLQYQRSQEYWFNRLETLPPGAELPLAKNPSSITKPEFKRRSAQLSPTQWKQLKDRGNQFNLTPSGVLLGAFAQILGLWSKSQKFTINLTLFNRLSVHPQVNDIVGDFTSLTLLLVDNSGVNTFVKSAQQLQQQLWQDLDRGSISAVKVQRELNRRRESYQIVPIVFTSTLGLESLGEGISIFEGLGEEVYSISQTPQVWLDNQVREKNGGLIFNWDGVEELFPEGLLDDMFGAYCNLLERLATSESAWMEVQQQLLPPTQLSQRHQVNNTQAAICEKTLHGLFIDQVKTQPQQVAVITNECQLTYGELYQRASALAQRLQQLGVTPNTLVAVVMEKGWEQVVGVLGILMSGGAYLPIDPSLPPQRQHYLLSQGQVKLVVTQCHLEPDISLPPGIQSLSVENILTIEAPDIPSDDNENNSNLAYVIYTSGSTGLPKGVAIDHRGAVNTIVDINQRFGIGNTDSVLAISTLNFDLSVYDIFSMLAAGGTIVIPPQDAVKDPVCWYELIVKFGVTIWNTVPALMQMLTEYLSAQPAITPLPLRLALLSGDWLPLSLPGQIQNYCGDIQIISLGGATEASIWSICYPIETVNPNWKSIPYGKPLTNQYFQILNELMLPAPVWVPGQLYIGGIGLANGYWGDEEKTNASFITHPITGERLYKTGDLGRYLPDGNIEFLGRDDFQVKINGYRIELGEIEATLKQHPTIKEAIVIAVGESQNKQQLVAYIVGDPSTQNPTEAYQPAQQEGVLQDPVERIEFKLKQPGLRQLEPSQHSVQLPQPEFDYNLTQAYLKRQSYRQFLPQPISLTEFSQFLSCLQQMKLENYPLPKYLYPSAGNLYPVQTYLLIKPNTVEGLKAGIYYYHPVEHRLILVSDIKEIDSIIYRGNQPIFDNGAFSLFLIGELNAITPMYGELAKDFCLLEAGHIGQLLMKSAPEQEIGLCPIGYLELREIQDLLQLESSHILLYSFVGGKIDLAQTKQWLNSPNVQDPQSISVQLRKYLRQKLPGYMIPSEYISLDALPLTANGKVDRKKLPVPNILNSQVEAVFTPPRTEIEKKLAEFVQELLQINAVGVDNNFFQLGMDSLKLVQLKNKLQTQLEVNISMKQLLVEANNIAELAVAVDEQLTLVRIKSSPLSAESNDDTEIIEL